jgi:hypothetical protein
MLRIENEVLGLGFDLTCAARLRIEDVERDAMLVEAMGIGNFNRTFGAGTGIETEQRNGPVVLDA